MSGVSQAVLFAALGRTRPKLRFLVVAGGGGGVYGGGGAGGMLEQSGNNMGSGTYPITVGAGGGSGGNGGDTAIQGVITVKGGGFGAAQAPNAGGFGGSGGGACAEYNSNIPPPNTTTGIPGAGIAGQGHGGGTGQVNIATDGWYSGGGGGGAGGAGADSFRVGGTGGVGRTSDITGTNTYYAGGGGGGGGNDNSGGDVPGSPGAGVYGRGGQGGRFGGGAGQKGVVIIRYEGPTQAGSGGTVTRAGTDYVHTFTSSGNFVWNPAPA